MPRNPGAATELLHDPAAFFSPTLRTVFQFLQTVAGPIGAGLIALLLKDVLDSRKVANSLQHEFAIVATQLCDRVKVLRLTNRPLFDVEYAVLDRKAELLSHWLAKMWMVRDGHYKAEAHLFCELAEQASVNLRIVRDGQMSAVRTPSLAIVDLDAPPEVAATESAGEKANAELDDLERAGDQFRVYYRPVPGDGGLPHLEMLRPRFWNRRGSA